MCITSSRFLPIESCCQSLYKGSLHDKDIVWCLALYNVHLYCHQTVVVQLWRHWFCDFFVHFVILLPLYARMIHSVMLGVLLHALASSYITKCHLCLPFSLVAVVIMNNLFVLGRSLG